MSIRYILFIKSIDIIVFINLLNKRKIISI